MIGRASASSPRAAARTTGVDAVAREGVRPGRATEVVEPEAQHEGAAGAFGLAQATGDPVDETGEARVDLRERLGAPAERPLGADRPPAPSDHHGPRIAVVRERMQVPARRAAEQRNQHRLSEQRDLADGVDAACPELLRGDRPDPPQPSDR